MTEELELQLVQKYPNILTHYKGDKMETCMAWGFEHNDGWYKILDNLLENLQYLSHQSVHYSVVAEQIKEKFGTLCFYYQIISDISADDNHHIFSRIVSELVSNAERESSKTCEITGKPGSIAFQGYWVKTLCEEKANELEFKFKNKNESNIS